MLKKAVTWSFILIGGYLVLSKATSAGQLLESGGGTINKFALTLQGR